MAIYALKTLSHIVIDSGNNCSLAPTSAYFLTIRFDKTRHKIIANNYVKFSSIFPTDAKYADNKYKSIERKGHLIFVKQDQHCNKVEGCFQYLCRHLFLETPPSYLQSIIRWQKPVGSTPSWIPIKSSASDENRTKLVVRVLSVPCK